MKILKGDKNQCQGCKEYFNSNGAFEKHRTGVYGVNRRCRTPEEMLALGFSVNAKGFWITSKRPEHLNLREMEDADNSTTTS